MNEIQHVESQTERAQFLDKPERWTPALARKLAVQEGIGVLKENHWAVIDYLRRHYLERKTLPVMKLVCHELELKEGCISALFKNPEIAWRLAGLPDPGEEAKSYMETSEVV